jgi:hypothetical protein
MFGTGEIRRIGLLALGASWLAAGSAAAQDGTKTIQAEGMSFKAPESWKSIPVQSPVRKAQLQIEPVKGEDFPATLVVYVFRGGAGSVEANVERWQKQFVGADGNPPKIENKTLKGKNTEVTLVETAGHYKPRPAPGAPPEPERENARLLGGIVTTEKNGYFLKMIGPDKTMASIRPAFEDLIKSIEIDEK